MTNDKLLEKLIPNRTSKYTAQLTESGLNVNISPLFSALIKDAARCNCYNSDIYYELREIDNICRKFDPKKEYEPIWIGFRKMGVDCTDFIVHRINNEQVYGTLSQNYFALYCITFEKESDSFYKIVVNEYDV